MKITPQVQEALDLVQEECSEIIQAISKIRRFGPESYHPDDPDKITNDVLLTNELGDFVLLVEYLIDAGAISTKAIDERVYWKREKLKKYTSLYR